MEEHGKVIAVCNERQGTSARTGEVWRSQDIVIETDGRFPRRICATLFGTDKIEKAKVQVGEYITIHFDIDSHEYQGKWWNETRIYDIVRAGQSLLRTHVQTPQEKQAQMVNNPDDLPLG